MKYTCPKCGKHLELSVETLIANEYKTVCPQCLTQLEIVGDYAYVPLDDGSLELRRQDEAPQQPAEAIEATSVPIQGQQPLPAQPLPAQPLPAQPLPSQLGGDGRDPLFDEAVRFLGQCSAITPVMLRDYFNIPFERAQDLIRQLEQAGLIGPYRGGAPRPILNDQHQGQPRTGIFGKRYDPNTQQSDDVERPQGGKMVSINCGSCLIWLVLIGFLIFLLVK